MRDRITPDLRPGGHAEPFAPGRGRGRSTRAGTAALALSALLALSGCLSSGGKNLYPTYEAAPRARDFLVRKLADTKVIFLPETHVTVGPVLFLAENLEAFREAGLRYLFLEAGLPGEPGSATYGFYAFYPWSTAGWKQEWTVLVESLRACNEGLAESERIKVICPEEGSGSFVEGLSGEERLKARDRMAARRIMECLAGTAADEKAIVFYGADHGAIKERPYSIEGTRSFAWKPLGAYLREWLGKDFYSLATLALEDYVYAERITEEDWRRLAGMDRVIEAPGLPDDVVFAKYRKRRDASLYDGFIVTRDARFGTCYQYSPTDANLAFMYRRLVAMKGDLGLVAADESGMRFGRKGQFLAFVYYLKLYFGDRFDYSLWDGDADLGKALEELGAYAFQDGSKPSEKTRIPAAAFLQMERYHRLMFRSGIEQSANSGAVQSAGLMVRNMTEAHDLFPADLWPLYWKGVAEMSLGKYGDALRSFELVLDDDLSSCIENLPGIYAKASACASGTGDVRKAADYKAIAARLAAASAWGNQDFSDLW